MRQRVKEILKEENGAAVIEMVLVIVGIFTPYYGVGMRCMA